MLYVVYIYSNIRAATVVVSEARVATMEVMKVLRRSLAVQARSATVKCGVLQRACSSGSIRVVAQFHHSRIFAITSSAAHSRMIRLLVRLALISILQVLLMHNFEVFVLEIKYIDLLNSLLCF